MLLPWKTRKLLVLVLKKKFVNSQYSDKKTNKEVFERTKAWGEGVVKAED